MQYAAAASPFPDRLMLAEQALAEAQALLAKILPDFVIERLKAEPERPITDSVPDASVLFADIAGFVGIAKRLGGERTVSLLNDLIRQFDDLAARHGVEKIKTMGDGYMAVAGVPRPQADHCKRLARLAIDMQVAAARASEKTGIKIRLRIGIASGPVTAGVIGFNKFTYDVWGDTVNLAARLEQLAACEEILVSEQAKAHLGADFQFSSRGTLQIRGLGTSEGWVLEGEGALH